MSGKDFPSKDEVKAKAEQAKDKAENKLADDGV